MQKTKVCIIGAGPAGTMTALRLGKEGVPFILLDKDNFPREKICGDGLSGKVPHIIRRLSPGILERFEEVCKPLHSYGMRFLAPGDFVFDVAFIHDFDPSLHPVPGYTVKRELLDDFMLGEAQKMESGEVITGCAVLGMKPSRDGYLVDTEQGLIAADILVDAAGTSSKFQTPYLKPQSTPKKTAVAIRSYYEGVSGFHPDNYIELFFLKDVLPGYLWIFPMGDGRANVGVGLRKDVILKKKIRLTEVMNRIISEHPLIAPRFTDAKQISRPAAYSLPLGNPSFRISGDHYMLAGDAGHLVDPLTGEGIGNALYSGYIAAEQAIDCLAENRFDASFMKAYDKRIYRVLGKEMSISANIQRMLFHPGIVSRIARKASKNKHVPELLSSMYTNMDYRKKLYNPFYILRVLLNK